ncbi:MAG: AraC family transcriptional regulator [Bacteroidota bacterium]
MFCSYCEQLIPALPGQNYCSRHQQRPEAVKSNAFLLRAKKLQSDLHQSRWAFRAVLHGYQLLESNAYRHSLHASNYLITPQGADYRTEIAAEQDVEVLVVGFHPRFFLQAFGQWERNSSQLLDNPEPANHELPVLWETAYERTPVFDALLSRIKTTIEVQSSSAEELEELYTDLVNNIAANHTETNKLAELIPAKKPFVRTELFRRLRLARDYMESQLDQTLNLEQIAAAACLSPFHFLRLFRATFRLSPMQFLAQARLQKAQYLLQHTTAPVASIAEEVSFTDQGAFARWFKRYTGHTPSSVRLVT